MIGVARLFFWPLRLLFRPVERYLDDLHDDFTRTRVEIYEEMQGNVSSSCGLVDTTG